MEDNIEFKSVLASAFGGVNGKNMIILPYARNINYKDGMLSLSLDFINDSTETEIGLKIKLSDDLIDLIDDLLYGKED